MEHLDARTIIELLVGVIFTLWNGWLSAEKAALRSQMRSLKEVLEAKIQTEVTAREGLERELRGWLERLDHKLDKVLEHRKD